jgi:Uma2 family endonuclease
MTSLAHLPSLDEHTVLHGVTWDDYERVLKEIGNGSTRVTFCDGSMEIMSPLPEHENAAMVIGRLVGELTLEVGLPFRNFGSTTYRRKDLQRGLEPDQCFYIHNESRVRDMKRFNPKVHPAPDLAIEVDVTRRSIRREPIYASLGVPEIWRYKYPRISIRRLTTAKIYEDSATSLYFPFLPMAAFENFVRRMLVEEQNSVVREFRQWIRALPQ